MDTIKCFDGGFAFLSNFYECTVRYQGVDYPSSENAFQAAKVWIPGDIEATNKRRIEIGFTTVTAGQSKRLGKSRSLGLRKDWESVKDSVMYEILKEKFTQNTKIKELLTLTGSKTLVEGNYWHDNYWGNCSCEKCKYIKGKNVLGESLMKLRKELI